MSSRLQNKRAIVVGAGQAPGVTIGNGRATALLFAREGAEVVCVDRKQSAADETVAQIQDEGGTAHAFEADIRDPASCAELIRAAHAKLGRIDILHNNVGIGGGDAPAHRLEESIWDRILDVNLKSMWLTIKHVLPIMRTQGGGAIVNVSSLASLAGGHQLAYEVSKAGVNRLTTSVAASNARHNIRCNAVMPGFLDTPMAVDGIAQATGRPRDEVRAQRDARVPLGGRMGTGWDTAHAALFLASDEAGFITGAILPVDGGMATRMG